MHAFRMKGYLVGDIEYFCTVGMTLIRGAWEKYTVLSTNTLTLMHIKMLIAGCTNFGIWKVLLLANNTAGRTWTYNSRQKLASLVQGVPSHTMPRAIHSYSQINNNPIDEISLTN